MATGKQVLAVAMDENDGNATTINEYLHALLIQLLLEKEQFSGKRPFGNSDWEYDLYAALIRAGYIRGSFDDDGYIDDVDDEHADRLIKSAADALFGVAS